MDRVKLVSKNLKGEKVFAELVLLLCQHVGLRFVINILRNMLFSLPLLTASGNNQLLVKLDYLPLDDIRVSVAMAGVWLHVANSFYSLRKKL